MLPGRGCSGGRAGFVTQSETAAGVQHMRRIVTVVLVVFCAGAATAQTDDLMITEYVEGSGYNKAIEIFNGTGDTVNLAGYALDIYFNGTTVASTVPLDAVDLPSGETHVVAHNLFVDPAAADQMTGDLNFNGDDAVVLSFNGTPVDRIGRVGEDPGSYWSCGLGTTQNHTLRRLSSVCGGDTDTTGAFDLCVGWQLHGSDTINGLGYHLADCGIVPNSAASWGAWKAGYR
jgi:predicted extracellular nuclease